MGFSLKGRTIRKVMTGWDGEKEKNIMHGRVTNSHFILQFQFLGPDGIEPFTWFHYN